MTKLSFVTSVRAGGFTSRLPCKSFGVRRSALLLSLADPPCLFKIFEKECQLSMKQLRGVVRPLIVVALLFCSLSAFSQRPEPRLQGTITGTDRATLVGSRSPRARLGQDLGAVSPEMTVPGITLVFKRSVEQESALQELLAAQQNTASPLYHQWLTPDTFSASAR